MHTPLRMNHLLGWTTLQEKWITLKRVYCYTGEKSFENSHDNTSVTSCHVLIIKIIFTEEISFNSSYKFLLELLKSVFNFLMEQKYSSIRYIQTSSRVDHLLKDELVLIMVKKDIVKKVIHHPQVQILFIIWNVWLCIHWDVWLLPDI